MEFHGKTALITGASKGIGKAIALSLAQQKVQTLLLVARDRGRLQKVAQELEAQGVKVSILPLDLAEPRSLHASMVRALRHHPPIDLLVNCAGVAHQRQFIDSRLEHLEAELMTNLLGMYTITRLVARQMVHRRQGHIVNVSSLMGKVAAPSMASYSATKHAIVGFSKALRSELAPHNVKVTNLMPSLTQTDMVKEMQPFRGVQSTQPEQVAKAMMTGVRWGQAEILVGWQSHLAVMCDRIAPWLLNQIIRWTQPRTATTSHYGKAVPMGRPPSQPTPSYPVPNY
jgi:3-oxoacyl-[acyl-carrier protein] reductase